MRFVNVIHLIILLLVINVSCTERIDIKLDDSFSLLVVDGSITNETKSHKVILSRTSSYFYNQPAKMVSGAQVTIRVGGHTFDLTEKSPGIYMTEPVVFGIPKYVYTLNIKLLEEIGGYTEYTASSFLNPVNPIDSIELAFHPDYSEEGSWEVKSYAQDPLTFDFYRFLIYRNQTLVTDTLKEWNVIDDKFFNGYYANGATIAFLHQNRPDEKLKEGDLVTAEINSIGEEYANFLWDTQSELFGSNPIFSGPPANVKGNINNGAIGFFAAYSVSRASTATPKINK